MTTGKITSSIFQQLFVSFNATIGSSEKILNFIIYKNQFRKNYKLKNCLSKLTIRLTGVICVELIYRKRKKLVLALPYGRLSIIKAVKRQKKFYFFLLSLFVVMSELLAEIFTHDQYRQITDDLVTNIIAK